MKPCAPERHAEMMSDWQVFLLSTAGWAEAERDGKIRKLAGWCLACEQGLELEVGPMVSWHKGPL